MDVQITGRLPTFAQMGKDRFAYIFDIGRIWLSLQMLASRPQKLDGVMFRSQRQGCQIQPCRARGGQRGCQRRWFRFGEQGKERCAKMQHIKKMCKGCVQRSGIPGPIVTAAAQRGLIRFDRFASPEPSRP